MRYQGSKAKFAKELKKIIEPLLKEDTLYVEPFGGGMNLFAYIDHPNKIANDFNEYVIALWKSIQRKSFKAPESLTEEEYYSIKNDCLNGAKNYSKSLIGYVANCCSNGSGWWNGYAHFNPKRNEDHIREAKSGLEKQVKNFKHLDTCRFRYGSYSTMRIPEGSVVYCDPPYASTKSYKDSFDNDKFWEWARKQVHNGNTVLVSEYTAPDDFVCIWSKGKKDGMANVSDGKKQNVKIEKLFVHKSQVSLIK